MRSEIRPIALRSQTDEVLMTCYSRGDVEAFDELFRRFEPRAFAYFVKRTHSRDRAQDLYQELFLRLHRNRHSFDPDRAFAPWFFQIARRLLIDDVRRAFRERELPLDESRDRLDESMAVSRSERDELARLLDLLAPDERYVLVASKGDGVGYAELANQLGRSIEAVRKLSSRAALRLREASR